MLFLLLVAALLLWQAREPIGGLFGIGDRSSEARDQGAVALQTAANEISRRRGALEASLKQAAIEAKRASVAELRRELRQARDQREQLASARRSGWQQAHSLATFDQEAIVADRTRELQLEVLERKIAGLQTALAAASRTAGVREEAESALRSCRKARARLKQFDEDHVFRRELRQALTQERTRLAGQAQDSCVAARNASRRLLTVQDADHEAGWDSRLSDDTEDLLKRAAMESVAAQNTLDARFDRFWQEWRVEQVLWTAAGLLLVMILLPYAIRLLFYYVLAPLAERRGSIRLRVPGSPCMPLLPAERSAPSVAVRLSKDEELLVRQGYLQSSSLDGDKATRWLLDWRHPLSSLASGLWFLTRIRGEGQVTIISAVQDPFAEVVSVGLPEGASCVLQPRALAAVATPLSRSLRVTSDWRLFSLNAWLTLQLRYIVFHGPARLVLKGGRGVRLEEAEEGRMFGQDQLIGFSANLAYSVKRSETFWPYFLGREPLFRDRVEAGEGLLMIEEAPLAGRSGIAGKRGLEGAVDAALKAIGL
jgi:uncharacterized protein (AIM24 family)